MKLSNFLLSIVASVALGLAIGASSMVVNQRATSVISVPSEEGVAGGGLTIELPNNLTKRQAELLGMAYETAKKDGHRYPQLLQAILMRESRAGDLDSYKVAGQEFGLKTNERYYGVMQIKLAAARAVMLRYPNIKDDFSFHTNTDEEVIAKLIEDDTFNLSVASKYLLILKAMGYDTMQSMALAYNQGPGGAKNPSDSGRAYAAGVMKNIKDLTAKR